MHQLVSRLINFFLRVLSSLWFDWKSILLEVKEPDLYSRILWWLLLIFLRLLIQVVVLPLVVVISVSEVQGQLNEVVVLVGRFVLVLNFLRHIKLNNAAIQQV